MIRKQIKYSTKVDKIGSVPIRNTVYQALMINSEYMHRAETGQFGKSPEGKDHD